MVTSVSPQAVTALAAGVRQRLMLQAGQAMLTVLDVVQERLIALMDEAVPSAQKQLRRDAWLVYQKQKNRWHEGVLQGWQKSIAVAKSPRQSLASLYGGLELLGTEVVEDKIVASRMALLFMEKAASEVNDLRKRLRVLNNGEDLATSDIVHPEVLLLTVIEQWTACGMPRDAWLLVNDVVEKHLSTHLKAAYAACNAVLIERGVSAAGPVARARPSAPAPLGTQGEANAGSGFGGAGSGWAPPSTQMRAMEGAPVSGHAPVQSGAQMAGGYSGPPGAYWQGPRAQGLIDQIGRLLGGGAPPPQQGAPAGGYMGGGYVGGGYVGGAGAGVASGLAGAHPGGAVSVPLMAALAQQPALGDVYYYYEPGAVPQVAAPVVIERVAEEMRKQSAEVKSKAQTDGEKAIVELVALMFQAILEEDRIPAGIRVWFARLQMPVLRVALAEPDFFTRLDHPTRQLLDHMGSCVMGFDASGIDSAALETEIKRIVQVIEQYPDTGERVYKRVYEEFQVFLKMHLTHKPTTQKVVGVAEKVEQRETLTIQHTIELRNQLKDMPVRDEIREFLYKVWAEVLAVSSLRQGPQHEETKLLKKTASDLIWAASAKPNRSDRARVISELPDLLQCVRTGMSLLNLVPSAQEAHIKVISDILADAFMSKTASIADEQIQALAARLANLEDYISDDGAEELPLDARSIEDLLGIEAAELDVITEGGGAASPVMMEWVRGLDLGAWFKLKYHSQEAQVQYVWRSPMGHLHLFASAIGRSYLIQSPRLAGYLQMALLEPQESEPLTLRATRNALGKIEAKPERLLA